MYYRKSDGRWVATIEAGYAGGVRKRRTVTAATRRELIPKLARARKAAQAGVSGEAMTVQAWMEHWLDRVAAKRVQPRTLAGYRGYTSTWIVPHLGRKRLADLRVTDVAAMLAVMEDAGRSEATRRQAYAVLHAALAVAVREQRVVENVAARVDRPRGGKVAPPALTVAQAQQLLAGPLPGSAEAARWWVALLAGLRQGEALGLRWEDVHLDDGQPWLWVHQTAQARKGEGMVVKSVPKSGKARAVALLPEVTGALRAYRTEHGGVGYVWGGERLLRPEMDHRAWKDALAAAGLPVRSLHSARATAETWLDSLGVPPRTVSDMLGHASLAMTSAYHRASVATQAAGLASARTALT